MPRAWRPPHDRLFKAAFGKPENAAAELRAVLPAAFVRRVDWSSLELAPGSFVDSNLAERHTDLLFFARFDRRDAYLYVLFEHQSTVDRFLAVRVLGYVVRIWERILGAKPRKRYLPPVVPVILHHSDSGWTAPRQLTELIRPNATSLPALAGLLPELRILIDDVSRIDDAAIDARDLPPFPTLALWALRDGRRLGRLRRTVDARHRVFRALLATPGGRRALAQIFRYISGAAEKLSPSDLRKLVSRAAPGAEDAIMNAFTQQLLREGRKQGRTVQEAAAVLDVLDARGLVITGAQREQILACNDLDTLRRWLRKAVTVATTAELFA